MFTWNTYIMWSLQYHTETVESASPPRRNASFQCMQTKNKVGDKAEVIKECITAKYTN